ncbi:hypothetical protein MKEN_00734000 [Mycena kentingensis (nom. inval.)]|nr:hypothetical protein MKEN_00734000 [Mycena kentingensis (nom. inval.)]
MHKSGLQVARGALFDRCSNFTINGGVFTQVNGDLYIRGDEEEEDFRRIRRGDIHLRTSVGEVALVEFRPSRGQVVPTVVGRTTAYHGTVFPSTETFTVVAHEGENFSSWKKTVLEHQYVQHPALVQLFGTTESRSMDALVFHEDLVPISEVFHFEHARSFLSEQSIVYLAARQFGECGRYLIQNNGIHLESLDFTDYTEWYSLSKGNLRIQLGAVNGVQASWLKSCFWTPFADKYPVSTPQRLSNMGDHEIIEFIPFTSLMEMLCKYRTSKPVCLDDHVRVQIPAIYGVNRRRNVTRQIMHLPIRPEVVGEYFGWKYETPSGFLADSIVNTEIAPGWTRISLNALRQIERRYSLARACDIHHLVYRLRTFSTDAILCKAAPPILRTIQPFLDGAKWPLTFLATSLYWSLSILDWGGVDCSDFGDYLFIRNPQLEDSEAGCSVVFPPIAEAFYWSCDPTGQSIVASRERLASGEPFPQTFLTMTIRGIEMPTTAYQLLAESVSRKHGPDSDTSILTASVDDKWLPLQSEASGSATQALRYQNLVNHLQTDVCPSCAFAEEILETYI